VDEGPLLPTLEDGVDEGTMSSAMLGPGNPPVSAPSKPSWEDITNIYRTGGLKDVVDLDDLPFVRIRTTPQDIVEETVENVLTSKLYLIFDHLVCPHLAL
jgi:hypothetical protein